MSILHLFNADHDAASFEMQTWMQRIARLGLVLMMGASMGACSNDQHWKEEVQLSDGRVIVVERELLTESGGDEWAINRSGSKPKEYRIRFEYPLESGKTVEWRSTKTDSGRWPEHPLVLDYDFAQPVVFTRFHDSVGCRISLKYVYQEDKWIEETLPSVFETRASNLLIFNFDNQSSLITLEIKREKNQNAKSQDFKHVGPKNPKCGSPKNQRKESKVSASQLILPSSTLI